MRFRLSVLVAASIVAIGGVAADARAARIYRLGESSSFQAGCFDPCDCLTLDPAPMSGVFALSGVAFGDLVDIYSVDQVDWTTVFNGDAMRIHGSGRYRTEIQGAAVLQQLELDLTINDGEVQHFDSGLVPITATSPRLDVTISLHGMFCADMVMRVEAAPVPRREILRYRLVEPSSFQEGCVEPCLCPTGPMLPLRGVFRLVPLVNEPPFARYAVMRVRWRVIAGDPLRVLRRIRGSGRYTLFSEFAVLQDLHLDLKIGSEGPVPLDSGTVVGGADFPSRIDVAVTNGGTCFERRADLHAVRIPKG